MNRVLMSQFSSWEEDVCVFFFTMTVMNPKKANYVRSNYEEYFDVFLAD